jgi:signal transduction histidine kinase/ligand-binding sensor domain-containing protein
VRNIYRYRQVFIWLGTSQGLVRFDERTAETKDFLHADGDAETLSSNQVRAAMESGDGSFWVATNANVDLLDRRTGKVSRHLSLRNPMQKPPTIGNPYVRLLEDKSGTIWVASARDGLAFVTPDRTALTFVDLNSPLKPEPGVWALLQDHNGAIWIGSELGLLQLDRERKALIRYRNNPADASTVPSDWVLALYEDGEDGIWVGTANGGAARISATQTPFRRYGGSDFGGDPGQSFIFTAYESRDGSVWAGGKGAIYQIDPQTGHDRRTELPEDSEVRAIVEDRAGLLWVGMLDGSLFRLNPATGALSSYPHGARASRGCANNEVRAFLIDHRGQLWLGAADTLCLYDKATDRFTAYKAQSPGLNEIDAIAEDSDGALWIGSSHFGLYRFEPATGAFMAFHHSDVAGSLSSDAVNAVLVDRSGTVWAGTPDGLNKLDRAAKRFATYREVDGLPRNIVNGIVEDGRGYLWIATSYGLSHFNPASHSFANYFRSAGVFDNLTGAWKGGSGRLYFGSYSGLTILSAQEIQERVSLPALVLTDLQIFDLPVATGAHSPLKQSISVAKSISLEHDQNTVSFEFAALTFSNRENLHYRYRLSEMEREWRETQVGQHSVRYSTLRPGRYTFEVQARTSGGNWTRNGAAIAVTILPPFWATWQFRLAMAVLMIWLLWQAHLYRLQRFSRQINIRFEERLAERSRIARELHDTLLQSVVSASMHLHVAAKTLPQESPAKAGISHILELMGRVVEEGRNTVQGLRSAQPDVPDLEGSFSRIISEMPVAGHVKFRVLVDGATRPLHPIVRDEVYRIGREAIINAFRHASANSIDVSLEYRDKGFRLVVHDDGRGLDPELLRFGREGHFGLPGMRERAEKVGGRLRVLSRPGSGTDVELTISGSAYESPYRSRSRGWFGRRRHKEGKEPE